MKTLTIVRIALVLALISAVAAIPLAYDRGKDKAERKWRHKFADFERQSFIYKDFLPAERGSARRQLVLALDEARAAGDHREVASLNGLLAQEAFERSLELLQFWERFRDRETGLVPRNIDDQNDMWKARDNASDQFPFFLMASRLLEPSRGQAWIDAMAAERRICGILPCSMTFRPARITEDSQTDRLFGASEYAKDGLLPMSDRLGPGPWFDRLREVADALIEAAPVKTGRGPIVAATTEVNGNMLQILARLYWASGEERYLQMAERIAEVYLFDVIPANNGLPADQWDFETGEPVSKVFRFRDHGNEIIPGLSEVYFLEKLRGRPKAAEYREPLKKLLDLMLTVGRTKDGLWSENVDVATHQVIEPQEVDNWGYLLNAYAAFDLAEGTESYTTEIQRTMRAATTRRSFEWEGHNHDGYADSLESMLYQLPRYGFPEAERWTDDEIEVMFDMQTSSGLVSGTYLDGNFIRTAMLYAGWKTQGIMADPWTTGITVGASMDKAAGELVVYVDADPGWDGVLKFDTPRHRETWHMPVYYPRLNATPEWFVVEPEKQYVVRNLDTGTSSTQPGSVLAMGLKVLERPGGIPVHLAIKAAE